MCNNGRRSQVGDRKAIKNKAPGKDNIPAEFLQRFGDMGLQLITKLMNNIHMSGKIPEDFARNIFITIPKVPKAQECKDFRTISLISHTSKILLQLVKRRITPIIERLLAESQMVFRKGKGTRDAIFQLRIVTQREIQVKRKIYTCFVDYQKAFDRVKHDKLVEIMRTAGITELEMKLIVSLYWNQYATVKTRNGISRIICIRGGVRQGCIISPILFLLYSEKDAVEARKGVIVNGQNINNLRFADDAVILACSNRS